MMLRTLLVLVGAWAAAQTNDQPEIRCDFRVLALSAPVEDGAYLMTRRPTALLIPSDFFSVVQSYRGPAELIFGRLEKQGGDAPVGASEAAARAALKAAREAETAYSVLAQQAANLMAGAVEGPGGEARRRRAEEVLVEAAEQAARAAQARESARNVRIEPLTEKKDQTVEPKIPPPRFKALGHVKLQNGGAYLLLVTEAANGWRITTLADLPDQHAYGTLRFINLTEQPRQLRQDGRDADLPGKQAFIHRPTVDRHGYAGLEIRSPGPEGRTLRTLRVYPEKNVRSTYLLGEDDAGGITVKTVHERRAP